MRKFKLFLFISVFFGFTAHAQDIQPCGTDEMELKLKAEHPEIIIEEQKLNDFVAQWIQANKDNAEVRDSNVYIIPLVFHIIHDYGTENISDDQVRDEVRILNLDYRKQNADTAATVDTFKSLAADAQIEFRLATKTPGGECTNGIEHIHSLTTVNGGESAKLSPWPRSMYLNVWVVKSLPNPSNGILVGYAYQPPSVAIPQLAPYDGVIIISTWIGSIGTSTLAHQHALTHEIGHTLNMNHPWTSVNGPINTACGDDGIYDTPITKGWFSICPLPQNAMICTPGVIENYNNYMDYASCQTMFTVGQVQVMRGVLNAPTADRNHLPTASNLAATGTADTTHPVCVPRVDFYSSYFMACTGTSITFHDVSWAGVVDSREWNFGDGNPATSTDQNPVVTFSTPGWKTITLTVSNSASSATETRDAMVFISDDAGQQASGYFENFESPTSFANDYAVQNRDGNESTWQRTAFTGYLSSASVYLNNYQNLAGDVDNLITPSFDLSSGGPLYLNFRLSCASHSTTSDFIVDALKIYSSTDCGKTWILRNTISGVPLANAGYFEKSFVPALESEWVGKSILLPSAVYDNNVRFRFEYTTNGDGNNIYLDDINVSEFPVGINDPAAASFDLKVFPNPLTESSVISIQQKLSSNVIVKLMDETGRTLRIIYNGWLSEGTHQFDLKASEINAGGMYFLVVDDGLTISREKLIVQ